MKNQAKQENSLAKNRKAFFQYEILEKFEAGIELNGDEVKSIRKGGANLKGSFVDVGNAEAFLNQAHISPYEYSSRQDKNPTRRRRLLLHKKEIEKVAAAISQKGVTAIPLELHLKGGLIKLTFGLCRGKKLYDKRETIKKREQERDIQRQIKKYK